MLDIPALEVVVALAFLYFVLSLVCSSVNETIAGALRWRSKHLRRGIENLLSGEESITDAGKDAAERLLRHPLIQSLARPKGKERKLPVPAYIPSNAFVSALLTLDLSPPDGQEPPEGAKAPTNAEEVKSAIKKIDSKHVQRVLLLLLEESGDDVAKFREASERWFDDAMDRVSGWYRRRTQFWLALWAVVAAVALNADTVRIAETLWKDEAVRSAVVAHAEQAAEDQDEPIEESVKELEIPLGWSLSTGDDPRDIPNDGLAWVAKVLGLVVTIFALLLGAPFWFDLLGKVARLRVSGVVPQKAEEASGTQATPTTRRLR
jgi:hypothetical protein